jgi:2,5-diamino-6-(ribosylamino)-4(3H)-pyrimidinone 5'-phosphate reductase
LQELFSRYEAKVVRVDSGGILNGILLRQGLVDEISVLIYPRLVGGAKESTIFQALDPACQEGPIPLRLRHFETLKGDVVWLHYAIIK